MPISLSLHQIIALLDGDDELSAERGWLIRNTFAAAECTVIRAELAAKIRAEDPAGQIIHVQSYTMPDTGVTVHTAWTPITWHESSERRRLHQLNNSSWRREQNEKHQCYAAAEELGRRITAAFGIPAKTYVSMFIVQAEKFKFNPEEFKAYLEEADKKFNISQAYELITRKAESQEDSARTQEVVVQHEESDQGLGQANPICFPAIGETYRQDSDVNGQQ
jgi:hypothetical protein